MHNFLAWKMLSRYSTGETGKIIRPLLASEKIFKVKEKKP
jgi:hypothetical protein